MDIVQLIRGYATMLAPTAAALVIVIVVLAATQRILERSRIRAGSPRLVSQLVLVVLSFAGLLVWVMPMDPMTSWIVYP